MKLVACKIAAENLGARIGTSSIPSLLGIMMYKMSLGILKAPDDLPDQIPSKLINVGLGI